VTGLGAAALYARLAGSLSQAGSPGTPGLILWGSAIILFQSSAAEVFFRGWIQRVLAPHWGALIGVQVTAAVFAGLHLIGGATAPLSVVNLFLGGLMLGLLALDRGGLAAAIGAHFAWNWLEQIGLGLSPNPGVGSFGSLIDFDLGGPSIWGGSSEGLNASLAMTFSLSAIVAALAFLVRRTPVKRSA
jgi:membrane protease YdiL (CAAX protease family)